MNSDWRNILRFKFQHVLKDFDGINKLQIKDLKKSTMFNWILYTKTFKVGYIKILRFNAIILDWHIINCISCCMSVNFVWRVCGIHMLGTPCIKFKVRLTNWSQRRPSYTYDVGTRKTFKRGPRGGNPLFFNFCNTILFFVMSIWCLTFWSNVFFWSI